MVESLFLSTDQVYQQLNEPFFTRCYRRAHSLGLEQRSFSVHWCDTRRS